jgi:eukaryotic-like serine/threonine-protein kinase
MKKCLKCQTIHPDSATYCPNDATPLVALTGLESGTTIRRKYRIDAEIGRGGMGVVYRAWHMVFREPRALKVINTKYANDPQFVGRFLVEAMVTHGIQHPNIVRVEDTDETEDGYPFVAMEFIEGRSLCKLLAEEGPLDPSRALYFASQVCAGLTAAHSRGIVHRDIKPDNILITEAQDAEVVKLLDFGIAKLKHGFGLTVAGGMSTGSVFLGTPAYASPEQARGGHDAELNPSSDLYSLGVVLYEMLTGALPFTGPSPMALLLQHMNEAPPDPREIWPGLDLPDATIALVMKALQKDPMSRFVNAEEMRLALERASYAIRRRRQELPLTKAKPPAAPESESKVADSPSPPAQERTSSVSEYIEAARREMEAGHYTAAGAWIERARGFEEKHNEVLALEREIGERRTRQLREDRIAKLKMMVRQAATQQELQQAQEVLAQTRKEFNDDPLIFDLEKELADKAAVGAERPIAVPDIEFPTSFRICLVCGTPNPLESTSCSKCNKLIQESSEAIAETPARPKAQPVFLQNRNEEKPKLLSIFGKSFIQKAKIIGNSQKYFLITLLAVSLLLFIGWLLMKPSSDSLQITIIGTAETDIDTELWEGTKIIGKLPKGAFLEILHQPGASDQFVQDPEYLLRVRTKQGRGSQVLSGFAKVGDLGDLEIKTNRAFTGWHALRLALKRFPNTEMTNLSGLRQYLESVSEQIKVHSEVTPPLELMKHQAAGYLSLARRSNNPDEVKMGCKNAERYIGKLPAGEIQALTAEYKSECAPRPTPALKAPCDEILKGIREKWNTAGDLYSNDRFSEAKKIFQQIQKAEPCNDEVRKIREQASEYYAKCIARLKSGEK